MKVWITKYALTSGIIEAEGEIVEYDMISASWNNGTMCNNFIGDEWHRTKKSAILKAEEMRKKKIESLKMQIKKLENLKFE